METSIREHSLLKSIVLHLLPGILIGIAYFTLVPVVNEHGFPSIMALTLAGIFVLVPFELGFLLLQRRLTSEKLFNGVIKYVQRIPVWQYIVLVPVIFIASGLIFTALKFSADYFMPFFSWIPTDMILNSELTKEFTKEKLIITYVGVLLFVVLILPIIEEFYFRGYLLPRMPSKLKGWAIIIHSGLFALYHTWSPWQFVIRSLGLLPLIYIVK